MGVRSPNETGRSPQEAVASPDQRHPVRGVPLLALPRVGAAICALDCARYGRMLSGGRASSRRRAARGGRRMEYLHTMVRISDVEASLDFWCKKLGLQQVRRSDNERARYTLIFLAAPEDAARAQSGAEVPMLELTYNWDPETYTGGRNFAHLAYRVDDIYAPCQRLMDGGVTINRSPRDGHMAFVRSPDGISIELLQNGAALPKQEPWASMDNTGTW
jgi:lactoylglutathione lyase